MGAKTCLTPLRVRSLCQRGEIILDHPQGVCTICGAAFEQSRVTALHFEELTYRVHPLCLMGILNLIELNEAGYEPEERIDIQPIIRQLQSIGGSLYADI